MSSLGEDDADKQLKQAVPWVSDPQKPDDETRRLQEDIMEAAKRLERESDNLPTQLPAEPRTAVALRALEPRARKDKASSEERARRIWAQLKPEFMSPPSQEGFSVLSPNMAMAAGFLGAMAVSAIIALVVMNVVHHPTVGADVSSEERAAKGHSLAAATLGDLAKVSEAQAKMTRADEPAVLPETPPAAAPPNEIAAPKSPAAINSSAANLEPTQPEIVAPAASPAPAANAVPEPRPSPSLPPDEIAFLIKRGRDLIAAGDIASARLVLTLVAEAGDAEASFILASTFDPVALANLRVVGVPADPAKARAWYARAAELGSLEARQRLQALR
jgi:hypothetical protein